MTHTIEVLLVEDNPADIRLTEEALKEATAPLHLSVTPDGVEAMAFLHREGRYAAAPRPDIILLDLNLPRKSGREVLIEIKSDPVLRSIPVLMLTTSQAPGDIEQCYDLRANCYIVKSGDIDQFFEVMEHIEDFWFRLVSLPTPAPEPDSAAVTDVRGSGRTVLVVDDSPTIVTFISMALEYEGYEVLAALGEEALQVAHDRHPNVVLLDMMMPELDGTQISRRLRDDPATADIPIIVMSAHISLRASAALLPGNDWLPKPLDLAHLQDTVARWSTPDALSGRCLE